MNAHILAIAFALFLVGGGVAKAADPLTISGFGSLTLTTSDSENLGFRRNYHSGTVVYRGTPEFRHDSSLGIQANFTLTPEIRGVVQLLAKDRVDNSVQNALHYAFLEYFPTSHFSVRGGRVPLDIFLLSDYREVGFAYLWVRPVPDVYSTLFYDYFDGAEIAYQHQIGEGVARVKGYVGSVDATIPFYMLGDIQFSFAPIWGVNFQYTTGPWRCIAGFQRGTLQDISEHISVPLGIFRATPESVFSLSSSLEKELDIDDSDSDYISGGVAYNDGNWQILGELSRYRLERALGLTFNSGYLSVGYSFGEWTPYATFSRVYSSLKKFGLSPATLAALPDDVQRAVSAVSLLAYDLYTNQSTISFGTRWDVYQNMALTFQWDHNQISGGHSSLWGLREKGKDADSRVNIFSLSFSFFF